jgi:predicted dehydrogenase
MTELASHQIQVANWVLDAKPLSVIGTGSINYWNDGREVFDNVALIYKYPNGVQLIYDSMISNAHYGLEEQILGSKGTMELEIGKVFTENPPPAPGFKQLINQIEHKIFDNIPIGGPSWIPETANENKGQHILDKVLKSDGSDFQMDAFVASVRANKITEGLAEDGLNASVAALMGFEAIMQVKQIDWPKV